MAASPGPMANPDMPFFSQKTGNEQTWQIDRNRLGYWRCWDDEVVIYDDTSGDTMRLDVVLTQAFFRLLDAPATQAELTEHLAKILGLDVDRQLERYTAMALERFQRSRLIEPVSNRAEAGQQGVTEPST